MKLKKDNIVQKRNVMNEIRANNMTLQELRFFSIYLSKINAQDLSTRVVRFPMDDFKSIMELGRINLNYMKSVTSSLLSKVVHVPIERGGYTAFQLFKECTVAMDENDEWYVEIDAHDKALPLMFEFKNQYFSYHLWNALRLRSANQLRMYEVLKQYERIGYRVLSIEELRSLIGIEKKEYPQMCDFRKCVLDVCQKALKEHTDIKFTYEPHGKRGKGGKILAFKFYIEKNENYTDQLTLDMFILEQKAKNDEQPLSVFDERISFLVEACDNEFAHAEIVVLLDEMRKYLNYEIMRDDIKCYDYLHEKYNVLKMQRSKQKISHPFNYMKSLIGKDS